MNVSINIAGYHHPMYELNRIVKNEKLSIYMYTQYATDAKSMNDNHTYFLEVALFA